MKQLFRTRTLTHDDFKNSGLNRCLSAFDLTLLGIGAIIGTGIFVLTGIAAATEAGPGVILSFVVAGFACAFAALAYAELASSIGGCGSAYGYSYAAFGEIFAWVIGWILILEYGISVAAVANGWSGYLINLLNAVHVTIPPEYLAGPAKGGIMNIPATAIVLVLMGLLIMGAKESARLNAIMVMIKLTTIMVFIAVAAFHIHPENWSPFLPFGWFERGVDGHNVGVFAGASTVFFAYIGFDAVSTAAEEAKQPHRDLPIGIVASLAICTVLYIIVASLLTGLVPYTDLNVPSPVSHALELVGVTWASGMVAVGALAGITTVMLVLFYGLTRIIFAMARDGLLPDWLAGVSERTHTPVRVILICGIAIAYVAGRVPLGDLAHVVNIGTLAAFVMVCFGVVWLRIRQPDLPRPFKMPFGFVLPLLGVASCLALMFFLPGITWVRFVIWLSIGLVVYFTYSMRKSKLALGSI